jgi:uncharacterized protein (TIGR02145 family)
MKTIHCQNSILLILFLGLSLSTKSQSGEITLNFSGDNNGQNVELDSVWVKNLTQGCDTMLYGPNFSISIDTILTTFHQSINQGNEFQVFQNYPNPFNVSTKFTIYIPHDGDIEMTAFNILGQKRTSSKFKTYKGNNTFTFQSGGEEIYFLLVKYNQQIKSIRMIGSGASSSEICSIRLIRNERAETHKSIQSLDFFNFDPGDLLLFVGYTTDAESGLHDSPTDSKDYVFQFATNIPCIGNPIVEYGGQTYNTIQIYSQCWLKENLNIGEMIPSTQQQSNNSTIEKYCMADMTLGCDMFGGLYFWNEMMNYTFEIGGQGICPDGWHVPADIDWNILEGAVDSEFGIGNTEWENTGWRGNDAGGNLKQTGTENWEPPNTGATDAFGFCALPAGYFVQNEFWGPGYKTYLWSSNHPGKFFRNLDWNMIQVRRDLGGSGPAFSVRCIKD